jgi:DNA-binding transcriptional MerR regulator/methylmalonyl-CoA mutase cobalamin-binding subunit
MEPNKQQPDQRTVPRHSIAVVSRRTGISQLVLRAWERRYHAVVPSRTPTGRRKYTDRDLEKLSLLATLTGAGHRIGDVATLSLAELKGLAREIAPAEGTPAPAVSSPAAGAEELLSDAIEAVTQLNSRALEAVLDRALVDLSRPQLRRNLLVPLLVEIGQRWRDGNIRIAHEHMATSIVQAFLAALNSRYRVSPGAPVLAVGTPAGQMHELGALLAASHAYESGWDVLYLGPNLPAEELASAVRSRAASGVLLSLVFPHGDGGTSGELRELRRLVGAEIPIFVGGQAVDSYLPVLVEVGARTFSSFEDLERVLRLD